MLRGKVPLIRLFTTIYPESNEIRRAEYGQCFELNVANDYIDEICLLSEGGEELLPTKKTIKVRRLQQRPTYQNYFDWINELVTVDDISIIANTDIFFDEQLSLFLNWRMPSRTIFALSRWDYRENSQPELYDHNDSQDAWIFRGKPKGVFGNFPLGIPRCDNRIAAEFEKAGYCVLNPSFSLRCYHVHDSPPRTYLDDHHSEAIGPPYKYVWPHNLFGLPSIVFYNLKHRDLRLFWRFDRRVFAQWLPIRVMSKIIRLFRAST